MAPRRSFWPWVLIGLAVSAAVTALLWIFWAPGLFLFFFVPFLFFPLRPKHRRTARQCPTCGRAYTDPATAYCPRDGTPLHR